MSNTIDYLIVGSGFGGAVAACRLAEQGRQVTVLEQGGEITSEQMTRAQESLRALL